MPVTFSVHSDPLVARLTARANPSQRSLLTEIMTCLGDTVRAPAGLSTDDALARLRHLGAGAPGHTLPACRPGGFPRLKE